MIYNSCMETCLWIFVAQCSCNTLWPSLSTHWTWRLKKKGKEPHISSPPPFLPCVLKSHHVRFVELAWILQNQSKKTYLNIFDASDTQPISKKHYGWSPHGTLQLVSGFVHLLATSKASQLHSSVHGFTQGLKKRMSWECQQNLGPLRNFEWCFLPYGKLTLLLDIIFIKAISSINGPCSIRRVQPSAVYKRWVCLKMGCSNTSPPLFENKDQ